MSDEVSQLEEDLKNKDKSNLITFTLNHSNAERVKLREEYQKKTGRDLLQDIEKNTGSDFRNTLLAVYKDPVEYDADVLYSAMKGVGSDKDAITEIICFRDFDRLNKIKEKFKEKYGKELVPELKSETSGEYQKAILIMLDKERSKNSSPDLANCTKIAEDLYKSGEAKLGTNSDTFINYFTSLSGQELALVGKEYHKNYKRNLVECIESEFSGNEKDLLIAILYSLISPSEYFARKIFKCVEGAGTSDDKLIRCIVSRSDVDMKMIKRYFKQLFKNKDMIERVKEDTSGEYFKLLEGLMQTK